uniref:Uncharacterized protein n=1 Tax=Gadus morhua TaxID=8049 RepID=A0A8C5APA3_GADMO
MASANTSWSEENFSCSICLYVFSSPVSTPCGHNFCRTCVTKFWDDQVQYKCPVCNKLFQTRPFLRVNTLLSELAAQFRTSIRVKEQLCVKPGEVPCDVCTGTQLKAVKSCLVCLISYCQTHLEPHQRVAGLKKHRLVDPMDRLEDRMCKKHDRLLELFCHTEQVCVSCQDDLNQMVKERMKDTEKEAEDLIKELEQEIEVLTNRSSEVKQLSQTKDHLHFLQGYKSLKNSPSTRDWTTVEVCPPSHVGTLRRSLDPLEETLNIEMKKLRDAELKRVQQYEVDVTLDPDTASPSLILYEDGKQDNRKVMQLGITQRYPDHPQRFDYHRCCEVEWEGGVGIGVTYRRMHRRGMYADAALGHNIHSWCLHCNDGRVDSFGEDYCSAWYNGIQTALAPPPYHFNRIGVYLHRSAGTLSFYNVSPDVGGSSGKLTHIHTFHSTFTHNLYPGFLFWGSDSTVSLCRL